MMVVQHNLTSMFTNRQLGITKDNKTKSTEKLASGYRINKSADDAAGLSISEKMRSQVRGLMRGAQNTQDGISLIHTADGAMSEQVNMLQRIRELTIQAYNTGVNEPEDMEFIQDEVDELLKELQRVAEETEFNKKKILQGNPEHTYTAENKITIERKEVVYNEATQFPFDYDKQLSRGTNSNIPGGTIQYKDDYLTFNAGNQEAEAYSRGPSAKQGAGDNYQGEWTATLDDNLKAYVDFSPINKASDAKDLRELLTRLEGTGVGYSCGTCSPAALEIVAFVGETYNSINDVKSLNPDVRLQSLSRVNLSDYEKALDEIGYSADDATWQIYGEKNIEGFSTMSDEQKATAYQNKFNEVKNTVVSGLLDKIVEAKNSNTGHFLRATKIQNGADNYGIAFYDYRDVGENGLPNDDDKLQFKSAEGDFLIGAAVTHVDVVDAGQTYTQIGPEYLQVGANSHQGIHIDFPDMTLGAMGLKDYTIYPPEGYCTLPGHSYDEDFLRQCEQIGDHKYRYTTNVGGTENVYQEPYSYERTYTERKYDGVEYVTIKVPSEGTNEYGEKTIYQVDKLVPQSKYSYETKTETVSGVRERKEYVGGTTKTYDFVAYPPDTILRVDNAISYVSAERSRMGALENRLEYAYKYDKNAEENLQDAESRIRDTDMAEEMTRFAKEDILEQAGISMLSQANQANQLVVQLLG